MWKSNQQKCIPWKEMEELSVTCWYSAAEQYKDVRIEWMGYREKLRSLLLDNVSMKEIIQRTRACTDKATQKMVKEIISLMEWNCILLSLQPTFSTKLHNAIKDCCSAKWKACAKER